MAIYFIGDVHGCYQALQALLQKIGYQPDKDILYFSGDLVNKGPQSYDTMRFIMDLPHAYTVLGNHDLHFLALFAGQFPTHKNHNMQDLLQHPACEGIVSWLRKQPFAHSVGNNLLVHAGIHPTWDLPQTLAYSDEVSTWLSGPNWQKLLGNMYGNTPVEWHPSLTSWDRLRCIINIFTRMRFLGPNYQLDFVETAATAQQPHLSPWFTYDLQLSEDTCLYFGHWAALRGELQHPQCIALDGGYVWGGTLIAHDIDTKTRYSVDQLSH